MSQPSPKPWYCTRSVHGIVDHHTNIDGVALLRSQETPCDCVPPYMPTKPQKAPIRVTGVRRQREPLRLSRRDKAVLARLQYPSAARGGWADGCSEAEGETFPPLPPLPDYTPCRTVVPPCERQVADTSDPPCINVVRPLTDFLNFYQAEPKRNDFLEPSDLPLSQRALYNLYNPEFGYGGYPSGGAPPPPLPPAGLAYPLYPHAPAPPLMPLSAAEGAMAPTALCPCRDRHESYRPYGICFCPVCGESLLPAGQPATHTPATCPSTHQRRDHHHSAEWTAPSAVPLQEANYCLLCGTLLVQTPVAAAAAETCSSSSPPVAAGGEATGEVPPPPPYQSDVPLPLPVPSPDGLPPGSAPPPPMVNFSLPLPSPITNNASSSVPPPLAALAAEGGHAHAAPSYAEINQEDRNMVDLVLNRLVYNVAAATQHTTTNCGLHDCLICRGGTTTIADSKAHPAPVVVGGGGGVGPAVAITHNYFYK